MNIKRYNKNSLREQSVKDGRGQVIGFMRRNSLEKNASSKSHMLRNPRGWCWEESVLREAVSSRVMVSVIHDEDNGCTYTAPLSEFFTNGIPIDRGYGKQICLPISYWQVEWPENEKVGGK